MLETQKIQNILIGIDCESKKDFTTARPSCNDVDYKIHCKMPPLPTIKSIYYFSDILNFLPSVLGILQN